MSPRQSNQPDDRPPPLPGIVRIARRQIAEWQTDNAILLWFRDSEDVVSPQTLAVAAQGVLTALCRDMNKPLSKTVTWINQQPRRFQEQLRNPQNFFKHGKHKQPFKDIASFAPDMTTMVLIDNVAVYQQVFGVVTIPMIIFALRFSLENPKGLPLKAFKLSNGKVVELSQVEHLAKLSRKEFLEAAMPLVSAAKKGRESVGILITQRPATYMTYSKFSFPVVRNILFV